MVDSTWNDEGTIFGWHPQFKDQAQTVMTGLLPYLKLLYGSTVESYFPPGAVTIQSTQRWDKNKGGVIGEDDEFMTSSSAEDSWWGDATEEEKEQSDRKVAIDAVIDAKNVVTMDVPDVEDNQTLPSLRTKVGDEEGVSTMMQDILMSPPPMQRSATNDESTITGNLTIDTRIDVVETNMGNLDNLVSHMNHLLLTFMKEIKQGCNQSP